MQFWYMAGAFIAGQLSAIVVLCVVAAVKAPMPATPTENQP